jgi:hypothetical protein
VDEVEGVERVPEEVFVLPEEVVVVVDIFVDQLVILVVCEGADSNVCSAVGGV